MLVVDKPSIWTRFEDINNDNNGNWAKLDQWLLEIRHKHLHFNGFVLLLRQPTRCLWFLCSGWRWGRPRYASLMNRGERMVGGTGNQILISCQDNTRLPRPPDVLDRVGPTLDCGYQSRWHG